MRSQSHQYPVVPGASSFLGAFIQAFCGISTVFVVLGDLVAARTHTIKQCDHAEPPDAFFVWLVV